MSDDAKSVRDIFDTARDQAAQDVVQAPPEVREKIAGIREDAERERAELRDAQERFRPGDIATEKSRLLLQHATLKPTPSGAMNSKTVKPLGNDALEKRATLNVEQRYDRQMRASNLREKSLIDAALQRHGQGSKADRDGYGQERSMTELMAQARKAEEQQAHDMSRRADIGEAFSRAAREPDTGRNR